MAHHEENHENHETNEAGHGRHLADASETEGEYTSTDGVSHTVSEEEGSYIDTSENDEDTSVKGSYVDTGAAGTEGEGEGEYTDRDE
ncbi:hypothetical protein [Rathayibacter tanaceti]|uniref:Uncharacterized protein n=2 Tax=Rathayibacter tanaceti TaxID=1671680 RepID=A0A166I4P1_9MICO|nr:hypothetical protein [Rathayibacter tanaceti]KZX21622.1 hypothetical protein ACH61_01224 [Rathayibacter tanaceti]QHC56485.1 hypothetical protein GSU10_13170 [Rathayibacter tanaceti]TCO36692.1 hypothetical protein EV639_10695 [Rathayibacter tanaceti]